jgi:hypothetical protein
MWEAIASGANGFIAKPFDPKSLNEKSAASSTPLPDPLSATETATPPAAYLFSFFSW